MSKRTLLEKDSYKFDDLVEIITLLRAPDGCPWDREQDHKSIRVGLIEETYEVVEGIDLDDNKILKEELGDLLLQIVFHASIAQSDGAFDIDGVCDGICKKLIYRHPHVFGDVEADTSATVLKNWDELKKAEKGLKSDSDVLDSVSRALPSLMRAQKLVKKSGIVNNSAEIADNIKRYADIAVKGGDGTAYGQLLFECARLGSTAKIDLEKALYDKNEDFCRQNREK